MWHVSSILEHETVFTPEGPPLRLGSNAETTTSENSGIDVEDTHRNESLAGDTHTAAGGAGSATSASGGSVGDNTSGGGGGGARFAERVIGKTWSGSPAVVLRSLRVPGRDEAACTARWLRANGQDGGGVFGDDEGWTDQRLRLLADEWSACAGSADTPSYDVEGGGRGSGVGTTAPISSKYSGEAATRSGPTPAPPPVVSPRLVPRPFMLHTGHVIVPLLNRRVRETQRDADGVVVGHGLVLAVDRGVDWGKWESHLMETAAVATRCLERLEFEGEILERERVRRWKDHLLHSQTSWYKP